VRAHVAGLSPLDGLQPGAVAMPALNGVLHEQGHGPPQLEALRALDVRADEHTAGVRGRGDALRAWVGADELLPLAAGPGLPVPAPVVVVDARLRAVDRLPAVARDAPVRVGLEVVTGDGHGEGDRG